MGKRTVKNYPSPRLMHTIGATNQTTPEAIGELVANCFDARYEDSKLNIVVAAKSKEGMIVVTDDGKGMTDYVLEKAVCIAEDMSQHIEKGEGTKGHFGMGFKTSCSTLGNYYEIYTRPAGQNVEYHVAFDINEYSQKPSGADAWDVDIEDDVPDWNSPLGTMEHGTAFVIKKVKDKNIMTSAVLSYLGEAFKGHLETGDSIIVSDDEGDHKALPKEYDFVKGSKIEIDTVCGADDKFHITGWVALDTQIHNDGLFGFNIYRHNQLVEKWDKSWFKAHLMTSRIIGEVNMDFLDATFYKQGVQQSEDWRIVASYMTEYLKPIVKASRAISKQGNIDKPAEKKKIVKQLREDYNEPEIEFDGPEDDIDTSTSEKPTPKKTSIHDDIKSIVTEQSLKLIDGEEISITFVEKEKSKTVDVPFDYIFDDTCEGSVSELQVILYKQHPLCQRKNDEETMQILATSDAIYRVLVERGYMGTAEALKIRNEWLSMRVAKEK